MSKVTVLIHPGSEKCTKGIGMAHTDTHIFAITDCCMAEVAHVYSVGSATDRYECPICLKDIPFSLINDENSTCVTAVPLRTVAVLSKETMTEWIELWTGVQDAVLTVEGIL